MVELKKLLKQYAKSYEELIKLQEQILDLINEFEVGIKAELLRIDSDLNIFIQPDFDERVLELYISTNLMFSETLDKIRNLLEKKGFELAYIEEDSEGIALSFQMEFD